MCHSQELTPFWCIGDEEFRRELLQRVTTPPSPIHFGEAVHEAAEQRAERLLAEALKQMGWTEKDHRTAEKATGKVRLAIQLRTHTTMSVAWIAERLKMGSRGYATWLLHEYKEDRQMRLI